MAIATDTRMSENVAGRGLQSAAMSSVTAVVLNYNYGHFLAGCLRSIDAQSHDDLTVMVVDDASTDGSRRVVEQWAANTRHRTRLVFKSSNRGPAHSYNLAIDSIDTEFVAFIDADDEWLTEKTASQVEYLREADLGVVAVYSDVVDRRDGTDTVRPSIVLPDGQSELDRLLSVGGYIPLNSSLIRLSALKRIPPLDLRNRMCDFPMWIGLARIGRIDYHPLLAGVVVAHAASMSRSESLIASRLRILAQNVTNGTDRRLARIRGRQELHTALVGRQRPSIAPSLQYGFHVRDWQAFPIVIAGQVGLVRRVAQRLSAGRRWNRPGS